MKLRQNNLCNSMVVPQDFRHLGSYGTPKGSGKFARANVMHDDVMEPGKLPTLRLLPTLQTVSTTI